MCIPFSKMRSDLNSFYAPLNTKKNPHASKNVARSREEEKQWEARARMP